MKSQRLMVWCVLIFVLALGVGAVAQPYNEAQFKGMQWRSVGPYRGGRVLAVTGVVGSPFTYYFGGVAGGVWRTTDGGVSWQPISDKNVISSIGAIAVAESNPNVIYVGTGESCIQRQHFLRRRSLQDYRWRKDVDSCRAERYAAHCSGVG